MTEHPIYEYDPHRRTQTKLGDLHGPVKVAEQFPHDGPAARFNAWFAVKVTKGVGTMWCVSPSWPSRRGLRPRSDRMTR